MKAWIAGIGAAMLIAGAAQADVLNVFDDEKKPVAVDTAAINGCLIVFDSAGTPFEICKMEKVEVRPPSSTRARPGQETRADVLEIVYKRAVVEN
ncbi:MAG: hypothetical protein AAF401_14825 [Pseudomonadota bacterium]